MLSSPAPSACRTGQGLVYSEQGKAGSQRPEKRRDEHRASTREYPASGSFPMYTPGAERGRFNLSHTEHGGMATTNNGGICQMRAIAAFLVQATGGGSLHVEQRRLE